MNFSGVRKRKIKSEPQQYESGLAKDLLTKNLVKLVTAEAIPKINTLIVIRNIEVDITA